MNAIAKLIQDAYNANEPLTSKLALAAMDEILRLESANESMSNEYWRLKRERNLIHRALQNTGKELNAMKRNGGF
jgi:hypothetical protein